MKKFILKVMIAAFLALITGTFGCQSEKNLTGKQYIQKEQQYRNYEAAMERLKKSQKEAAKEEKKGGKKNDD